MLCSPFFVRQNKAPMVICPLEHLQPFTVTELFSVIRPQFYQLGPRGDCLFFATSQEPPKFIPVIFIFRAWIYYNSQWQLFSVQYP